MNGIVVIDKPMGLTSQDVVSKVKKIMNENKAGHIGTLDPLATGVFPVLIGTATKASKYLINHDKTYIASVKLGIKTSTGDSEGDIIKKAEVKKLDKNLIDVVLQGMVGKQMQNPPMYSAVKVKGKKLYEYARNGEKIEAPAREIEIYNTKLLNFNNENSEIEFEVSCSKGTYIRTLCENIAEKLNTVGFMKELRRTKVGRFNLEDVVKLDELNENSKIFMMEEVFDYLAKINLKTCKTDPYLNGMNIAVNLKDGLYNVYFDEKYCGLGKVKNNFLKRDIVF